MHSSNLVSAISIALGSVTAVAAAADSGLLANAQDVAPHSLYIVQADTLNTADRSVVRVNAKIEQEFEIIHSVSAYLTPKQVDQLRSSGIRVFENRAVSSR